MRGAMYAMRYTVFHIGNQFDLVYLIKQLSTVIYSKVLNILENGPKIDIEMTIFFWGGACPKKPLVGVPCMAIYPIMGRRTFLNHT